MKIGLPIWNDRISPVFDTAKLLLVVDFDESGEAGREECVIEELFPPMRVRRLKEIGIELLICGAISNPIACMIDAAGIGLIPWVSGNVDDVLDAYRNERLAGAGYRMPGCRCTERGFRHAGRGAGRRRGEGGRAACTGNGRGKRGDRNGRGGRHRGGERGTNGGGRYKRWITKGAEDEDSGDVNR